jgi:hypothetical protein
MNTSGGSEQLPLFLTPDEAAALLRPPGKRFTSRSNAVNSPA